jgi:ferrous iron transport protein A
MHFKDLSPGDSAVVRGYRDTEKQYLSKLMAMGITRGTPIRMVKRAPLGDPVQIEVRGFHLSLRKDEADILILGGQDE